MGNAVDYIKRIEGSIDSTMSEMLDRVALDMRKHVIDRTRRGVDINERRFAPYAPRSKRRKSGTPDLDETGLMLSSVRIVRVTGRQRALAVKNLGGVPSTRQKAAWHQQGTKTRRGSVRMPARRWFGVTTRAAGRTFRTHGVRFVRNLKRRVTTKRFTRIHLEI